MTSKRIKKRHMRGWLSLVALCDPVNVYPEVQLKTEWRDVTCKRCWALRGKR